MKKTVKVLLTVLMVVLLSASTFAAGCAEAATKKSKVKLNKTKVTLYVGQTVNLKVSGTDKKVTWSSSDSKIAKVSKKGKVTALKKGNATITAKIGDKKYTCKVTVKEITCKTVFSNGAMLTAINGIQFSTKEIRQYSDGTYEVDAYIYNGYNVPVYNLYVTKMSLYDHNQKEIASAAFELNPDLIIPGQSFVVWTFRYNSEHTVKGDFDFTSVYLNTSYKFKY